MVLFNMERPQFKDLAVRQAIYAAIDKEAIIDQLYYGLPTPTETFLPNGTFYTNPDLPKQQFDLDAAKKILDDAGWLPGAGGIREKDGVRLSFVNSTTSGNHLREQAQQFIQQTLAAIGIEMKIENMPAAVIWGEFWVMSQFDSVLVGITFRVGADPDPTNRLSSTATPAKGGKGSNFGQYANPEVDRLLAEGTRTFDPDQRREIYFRIQEIVREDLPFLPIYNDNRVNGWKSGIHGVRPNLNARSESWNAAQWFWAE